MSAPSKVYRLTSGERPETLARIARFLNALPQDRAFDITIAQHRPLRSKSQNALLWMMYDQTLQRGGEALGGWTRHDLHEAMLGEWGGWEDHIAFGMRRKRPVRRSSSLNKQDFSDFLGFIERFMAERGIVLDLPGDDQH